MQQLLRITCNCGKKEPQSFSSSQLNRERFFLERVSLSHCHGLNYQENTLKPSLVQGTCPPACSTSRSWEVGRSSAMWFECLSRAGSHWSSDSTEGVWTGGSVLTVQVALSRTQACCSALTSGAHNSRNSSFRAAGSSILTCTPHTPNTDT